MVHLDDHPLPDDIRSRVLDELKGIELKHNVTVLYACESGSRAWGFSSPNSDFDVRFIYVPKLEYYLQLNKTADTIELQVPELELDICGWSIHKTLGLLRGSNPALLEWLHSPLCYRTFKEHKELTQYSLDHFKQVAAFGHYSSMAFKTWNRFITMENQEVIHKKYFYCLRPLFAVEWIRRHGTFPPVPYKELVNDYFKHNTNPELAAEINELLNIKRNATEVAVGKRFKAIDEFICDKLFVTRTQPILEGGKVDDKPLTDFHIRMVKEYNRS